MFQPTTFVVLGPDRVGKTTLVNNTHAFLKAKGQGKPQILHFSGPKEYHNSPIDQYIDPIAPINFEEVRYLICDRFGSEVCFYENFRRRLTISDEWAISAESFYDDISEEIHVFLVQRDWEWAKPHHIVELKQLYPSGTKYFLNQQLAVRKLEHEMYYDYMIDYLENKSILNYKVIAPSSPVSTLFEFI